MRWYRSTSSLAAFAARPCPRATRAVVQIRRRSKLTGEVTDQQDLHETKTQTTLQRNEYGFSFSPAGLLFPYHLGVATMLRDQQFITDETPLGGSSAGALVAVFMASGLSHETALEACFRISKESGSMMTMLRRYLGQGKALKAYVHDTLHQLLPDDAHERINKRPGGVRVGVTCLEFNQPYVKRKPVMVESFESKEDLVEVLLASCTVPFWFTYAPPYSSCRGTPAVDGYFSVPFSRFGCPYLPSAKQTVLVSAFPPLLVARGSPTREPGTEWLSPDIRPQDRPRRSLPELLKDALSASDDQSILKYFEDGRGDAQLWADMHRDKKAEKAAVAGA